MFGRLPEPIQQQVLYHLQNDDFRAAKKIYDEYLRHDVSKKQ